MKALKETPMMEFDPQGMAHDLTKSSQVWTTGRFAIYSMGILLHVVHRMEQSLMHVELLTVSLNLPWIYLTPFLLLLLILEIIIIHIYIYKNYLLSFMELLVNIFCNYFFNLLFNFDQNVNAGMVLREETIKNPHQQSPLFCHLYCFTLISPALKFIRLLQQFPSYILQWVMLHGRNDVFYFCITFFRNFIILERCSFQRWN